ncbi:phospholipase [Pseudochryseolinea flava]|uniref:Phospholipase n=1 Tax=Pseudochryseolinea flava TaxID=2059302 RepID=A0A364Y966_9BACT|nr:phospholipase [Pseudochryseolinea flava]
MKNVRLVLGSGGARGMAHIGVIEELIARGYTIKEVAGSSMGAVVGGIFCAGYMTEYKHWLQTLSKLDVFRLLDFTLSSQGFVKGERVFRAMEAFVGDSAIENFTIPFTAVASDITQRKEMHYKSGSLFKALRSSMAIPTVFKPVNIGQSQIVDGGVLNPLPLNAVSKKDDELIVAVNLNSNIASGPSPRLEENKEKAAYLRMLNTFRSQILRIDSAAEDNIERLGWFDLLTKSYELTQDRLTELMIQIHQPDIVVNVSRDACGVFEFYRAVEIIECGRRALDSAIVGSRKETVQRAS